MSGTQTSDDLTHQANQLIMQGNVQGALSLFQSHLKEDPFDPKVTALVESLLMAPDQGRGFVDFYKDLHRSAPEDWRLLVCLARAYSKTGKDSLAVVQLQKLLRSDSQHPEVWMELAMCYRRLEKLELALRALNSLLEVQANYAPAHVARLRILVTADDLAEAAAASIFSLEVKDLPQPVREWLDRMNLQLEQGLKPSEDLLNRPLEGI